MAKKQVNKYSVKLGKGSLVFNALKILAKGKQRTDSVKLNTKQINRLKLAARKSKAEYFKVVDELIVKPCKLDSSAKKAGLTMNTGYDPAHFNTAKALGLKLK